MANQITTKILEIVKTKEREWKFWKMYSITLHCENGEYPILNKTKPDAFKVWDSVTYEVVEPGKKWKEITEKSWSYSKKWNYQSQEWYFTSIAFQIAFQWFDALNEDEKFAERVYIAKRIFAEMVDNLNNPEQKEEKTEEKSESKTPAEVLKDKATKDDEEDLPF